VVWFESDAVPPATIVVDHVEILSNRIELRRKQLGLTQEDAARRCGLTLNQFQRSALGTHVPKLTTALALATGLETSIDDLYLVKIHRFRLRRT
jgi:transcriptional regulator with XRE-family HTH domain